MKPAFALLLTLTFGTAPFQCANDPDPNERIEDTPAEALFGLAEHFRERGMTEARNDTLRQIIDRYPNTVEAEQARMILEGRELTPAPSSGSASGTAPSTTESP